MRHYIAILFFTAVSSCYCASQVSFERTPENAIQPQALVDRQGGVHLLYYSGDPKAGNLFYTRRTGTTWDKPMRVNTREGSAIAAGTIRGGQMALGKDARVHVAWNGAKPLPDSSHEGAPLFYTRLNDARTAFEPERDIMTFTGELDGGGSVAADPDGNVYVVWHGRAPDAKKGESERAVYLAKSTDSGVTFSKERAINPDLTGTCGCCGLKAFADSKGTIYVLYRTAENVVNRDEILLASYDNGNSFQSLHKDSWKVGACPMSSASLSETSDRVLAAWETAGQVLYGAVKARTVASVVSPGATGKRKHPCVVANPKGETLLVWAEGTGWERGGAVAWQLFDKDGKPLGNPERKDGLPTWSFATAYAKPDGNFVIIY